MSFQHCFHSNVSKHGAHLAHSFFITKCSCKTLCIRSDEMPIPSAIFLTLIRGSSSTILLIFSIISGVVVSGRRPLCGSSLVFVPPILNSATHHLTVVCEGENSPEVESSSFFITFAFKPFK